MYVYNLHEKSSNFDKSQARKQNLSHHLLYTFIKSETFPE